MKFATAEDRLEYARIRRQWAAKVAGHWSALARAKKSGNKDRIINCSEACLNLCGSFNRLVGMIRSVADQPPEIFWPVWLRHWSMIDGGGQYQSYMPDLFKRKGSAHPYLEDDAKSYFESLPDTVSVYRGCDERFKDGVSWTASRKVAEFFAAGGRCGRPRHPVVVIGRIGKQSPDFYYCDDGRSEAEIICTPIIEKIEPYTGPWPGDPGWTRPWDEAGKAAAIGAKEAA
jgi:hypothetical protein